MATYKSLLALQALVFLIPLNFFMWGDWLLVNFQWALVRYQQSSFGTSIIPFYKDIFYIIDGRTTGMYNILAASFWTAGSIFLLIGVFITLYAWIYGRSELIRTASLLTIGGGILYCFSALGRFNGGFSIPVGVPIILFIGWWLYRIPASEEISAMDSDETVEAEDFKIFNVTFHGLPKTRVQNDILALVLISIAVKFFIVFITTQIFHSFIDYYDISIYNNYAISIMSGQIPYVNFSIEYPQLAIIPMLISAIPFYFSQSFSVYALSFQILMTLFDIATLVLLYLIAIKLFGREKSLLCGLLYLTAFSTAYFVITKYDAIPTFIVILSLFLFIYNKEMLALVSASVGSLIKWFSILTVPFYIIFTIKNNRDYGNIIKGLIISFFFMLLITLPFIVLNLQGFIATYSVHIFRPAEAHSLIYYLDTITQTLLNISLFSQTATIILIIVQILLFYWYYTYAKKNSLTLCYAIFFSLFAFILLNKVFSPQYIVWITPFLALFLFHSYKEIALFFSIQLVFYLEHPLLYGIVYTPSKTYTIIENSTPTVSFIFFTIKFILLFVLLFVLLRQISSIDNECYEQVEQETVKE